VWVEREREDGNYNGRGKVDGSESGNGQGRGKRRENGVKSWK
jgi:hypothetical protein